MVIHLEAPACGHTFGVSAIDDPIAYDNLSKWHMMHGGSNGCFLQSDSALCHEGDKSYLYIEFLGVDPACAEGLAKIIALDIGADLA